MHKNLLEPFFRSRLNNFFVNLLQLSHSSSIKWATEHLNVNGKFKVYLESFKRVRVRLYFFVKYKVRRQKNEIHRKVKTSNYIFFIIWTHYIHNLTYWRWTFKKFNRRISVNAINVNCTSPYAVYISPVISWVKLQPWTWWHGEHVHSCVHREP